MLFASTEFNALA